MMKIYLSPSNQSGNKYVVGNTNEKVQMEAVAVKVKALLDRDYNCEAVMATLSLGIGANERPQEAKNKGCAFYIAIHSNAAGSSPSNATGAVAFFHPDSAKSKTLATAMVTDLNAVCPIKSNRASHVASGMTQFNGSGYGEIRSPMQKGVQPVLVEVNFHDNPVTAQWIIDNKDAIAGALVKSIVAALGIAKKAAPTTPPVTPPATDEYYRVRKTWADSKTQKGAYKVLTNAKKCADDNPGYSVFDPKGAVVYTGKNTAPPVAPPPVVPVGITDGSLVAIKAGTKNYYPGGSAIPAWVIADYNHRVTQTTSGGKLVVKGGKVCLLLGKKIHKKTGKEEAGINTWVDKDALAVVGAAIVPAPTAPAFVAYTVKVTTDYLNIRKGPSAEAVVVGAIKDRGIYTIVEEANGPGAKKWGKLKSGVGWVSLDYTQKR